MTNNWAIPCDSCISLDRAGRAVSDRGSGGGSATQAARYSRISRFRSTELAGYHPPFAAGTSIIDCTRDGWVRCEREEIRTIVIVQKTAKLHRCVCCWRRVVHENRIMSPRIGKGCCRRVATER